MTKLSVGDMAMLATFSLIMGAGQILFKATALQLNRGEAGLAGLPRTLATSWQFWLALFLYGLATLIWIRVLQTVPLNRAYPFMALAFVIVPAAGAFFFGEVLTKPWLIGTTLIIAGVLITSRVG